MQQEMCSRLLPVILSNFPSTERLVRRLWNLRADMVRARLSRRLQSFFVLFLSLPPEAFECLLPRVTSCDLGLVRGGMPRFACGETAAHTPVSHAHTPPPTHTMHTCILQVVLAMVEWYKKDPSCISRVAAIAAHLRVSICPWFLA